MSNSNIFRLGGIAAFVSAALYVASMVVWMTAGTTSPPPLANAAYIGSQVIFLVTLYALYVLHKVEAPALIVVAALLLVVTILASLFLDPANHADPLVLFATIGYGVASLILGWLALRSPRLTRPIAIAALLTGALSLVMVPFILAGNADLVNMMNLAVSLTYLVWLMLLGLRFLRSESLAVQAS